MLPTSEPSRVARSMEVTILDSAGNGGLCHTEAFVRFVAATSRSPRPARVLARCLSLPGSVAAAVPTRPGCSAPACERVARSGRENLSVRRRTTGAIRSGMIDDAPGTSDIHGTESRMSEHTFAITHLVGRSPDGIDAAIRNGITKAGQTLRNLEWFEVTEMRGYLGRTSQVQTYQVTLKLGFRYDD